MGKTGLFQANSCENFAVGETLITTWKDYIVFTSYKHT